MKGKPGKQVKDFNIFRFNAAEIKGNIVKPGIGFVEFKKEDIYQCISQRFEQQVNRYPGNIAIKTQNQSLTYRELDKISTQIAQILTGASPNGQQGVALLFEQGIDMAAGMLGTLKSGNFYIPLDTTYPYKRLAYMVKDVNARLILTNTGNYPLALQLKKDSRENLQLINIKTLTSPVLSQRSPSGDKPRPQIDPGYPAYILYTSGSTGVPKGVVQSHRSVLHFIRAYTNNLHISPGDRLIMLCSYGFDAAVMDIYGALLNGATLYPFDLKQEDGLNRLISWLKEEKITIFHSIPMVYRYLVKQLAGNEEFPALRLVVMGGEAVYKVDVENFKKYFSNQCIFINGLGPTESTVTLQYFIDKNSEITKEAVPVGFPVDETEVLLIDKNNREAFIYGSGEIVFKSDYLALGYLNHPEKNHGVFVKNPSTGKDRVFCSGDLGKRLPDGSIEYIGRKDHQVKINGYRVELGEIESFLDKQKEIRKSVVVCQQNPGGDNYLTAFYVKNREVHKKKLIHILNESLPTYMVPRYFVPLEEIPLTPSGKIDRKVLYEYKGIRQELPGTGIAPTTAIEKIIAKVVTGVLNLDKVSIHDNFFDLGINSLDMIRFNTQLKRAMARDIPVITLFRYSTIASLAEVLGKTTGEDIDEEFSYNDRSDILLKSKKGKHQRLQLRKRGQM